MQRHHTIEVTHDAYLMLVKHRAEKQLNGENKVTFSRIIEEALR